MNFYNGRIVHADLTHGTVAVQDLYTGLVKEALGGAGLAVELLKKYPSGDPIVVATGPLTGTPFPGGSLVVASALHPSTGKTCHAPVTWQFGAELKLSGFDVLIITGRAETPQTLWLHDGLAEFEDAAALWGKDTWEATDSIRKNHGDEGIQVLCIGRAGETGSPFAMLSENHWGSKDALGMGALFGRKNLKAVAVRGLGSLELPEGFLPGAIALRKELQAGALKGKTGLMKILTEFAPRVSFAEDLLNCLHRTSACFSCPYPCYAFFKFREKPGEMRSSSVAEPGVMMASPAGLMEMLDAGETLGWPLTRVLEALEFCCRLGLQPQAAAMHLKAWERKDKDGVMKELISFSESPSPPAAGFPLPRSIATGSGSVRGTFFSPAVPGSINRQALAYVLGVCPIFVHVAPELTPKRAAALLSLGWEWCTEDMVDSCIARIPSPLMGVEPPGKGGGGHGAR